MPRLPDLIVTIPRGETIREAIRRIGQEMRSFSTGRDFALKSVEADKTHVTFTYTMFYRRDHR